MSHEIVHNSKTNKDLMIANSDHVAPWHGLGTRFTDADGMTPIKALPIIEGDYTLYLGQYKTSILLDDGTEIPVESDDKSRMIVRGPAAFDPKARDWAKVSKDYQILQPVESARLIDPLSKYLRFETAGTLRNGKIQFFSFRGDRLSIGINNGKSDEMTMYLNCIHRMDGGSFRMILSPVQTVCMNTVYAAESSMVQEFALGHKGDLVGKLSAIADTMVLISSKGKALEAAMQKLADTPISDDQAKQIFEAAAPAPKAPVMLALARGDASRFDPAMLKAKESEYAAKKSLADSYFSAMSTAYYEQTVNPDTIGTAWGAYSAVTHVSQHLPMGTRAISARALNEAAFIGERTDMGVRAWIKAMEIADKNN